MSDGILLSQASYANKLIGKLGLKLGKTGSTPLDIGEKYRKDEGSLLPDSKRYRSLVGRLLYLTITWLDIA